MMFILEALLQPLRRLLARRRDGGQIVFKFARPVNRRRGLALARARRPNRRRL